jgi:hypothetical protein
MTEAGSQRPKCVIVVDADNPLVEIHGEFFWREDHETVLAAARDDAFRAGHEQGYRQGYGTGWGDAARQQTPRRFLVTRHRSVLGWARLLLVLVILAALLPLAAGVLLEQLLGR